jgi:hypothetical protein
MWSTLHVFKYLVQCYNAAAIFSSFPRAAAAAAAAATDHRSIVFFQAEHAAQPQLSPGAC